jgi:hypothetical protein
LREKHLRPVAELAYRREGLCSNENGPSGERNSSAVVVEAIPKQ